MAALRAHYEKKGKPVIRISRDGESDEFSSIAVASRITGIKYHSIWAVVTGVTDFLHGFMWRFKGEEIIRPKRPRKKPQLKLGIQLVAVNDTGVRLDLYSLRFAARHFGVDKATIQKWANTKKKTKDGILSYVQSPGSRGLNNPIIASDWPESLFA